MMTEWFAAGFIVLFILLLILNKSKDRSQTGKGLREISAFRRIRKAIALAVESGGKIHLAAGASSLTDMRAGVAFASLGVLRKVIRMAAFEDQAVISSSGEPVLHMLMQETAQSEILSIKEEAPLLPEANILCGVTPAAYVAGAFPLFSDPSVSAHIIAGSLGPEVGLLVDTAHTGQKPVIAGSDNLSAQSVLWATTEDPLLGEELFSGSAYLQPSDWETACLKTHDIMRWVLVIFLIVSVFLKVTGVL